MSEAKSEDFLPKQWLSKALRSTITGLFFSLLLSALIVAAVHAGQPWALAIERVGTDWSMKIAAALHGTTQASRDISTRATPIVFLDIDEEGCRLLTEGNKSACQFDRIGQVDVLVKIGDALKRSGAKVIVLDMLLPGADETTPKEREALLNAWAGATNGPMVVAAMPTVAGQGTSYADWKRILTRPANGRLRFAPAIVQPDPTAGDGVIRNFPSFVQIASPEPKEGVVINCWPSLAFLTAALLKPNSEALDCAFYAGNGLDCPAGKGTAVQEQYDTQDACASRVGKAPERMMFSLLSQTPGPNDEARPQARLFDYERRPVSKIIGTGGDLSKNLEGTVVIVGSSASAAQDWKLTPLGPMPGGELVANAIRAFEIFPQLKQPDVSENIVEKVLGSMKEAALMFFVWCLIHFIFFRSSIVQFDQEARGTTKRLVYSTLVRAGVLILYLASATFIICMSALEAVENVDASATHGVYVDLLFPMLAGLLGGTFDGIVWLNHRVEWIVTVLVRGVNQVVMRVSSRFLKH